MQSILILSSLVNVGIVKNNVLDIQRSNLVKGYFIFQTLEYFRCLQSFTSFRVRFNVQH